MLSYPSSKEDFRLNIPAFEVKSGEVVAVVGRVGSGEWLWAAGGEWRGLA